MLLHQRQRNRCLNFVRSRGVTAHRISLLPLFSVDLSLHEMRSAVDLCRLDDGVDVTTKPKAEQIVIDGEKPLRAGGLVPSEGWADNTPVKKVQRTDSQKKEKRQRTLSLKTNKKMAVHGAESPPPLADMEGMLERKHLHQSGGKLATLRSWKSYYTVLAGQLLCFFKDQHGLYFTTSVPD